MSTNRRNNNSGELDVFEAARYFSGYNDNYALIGGGEKMMIKQERQGRASLDIPSLRQHQHYYQQYHQNHALSQHEQQQQQLLQQQIKDKKKYKQPSSPGGKLAHFLNSLFNQTTSKKKKQISKFFSTQSMKDEDESPSGRRKRRSSISHFRSTSSEVDAKSMYSTSSKGFRTPPPYTMTTPTKNYKEFTSFSDYKDVLATLSKYKIHENGHAKTQNDEKIKGSNLDWIDEKFKLKSGILEKSKNSTNSHQEKKRDTKKFNEEVVDDGAESDSSSDLFELQIDYEFGFCSSGLPVYETTHMDNIKRPSSTTITSGPIIA